MTAIGNPCHAINGEIVALPTGIGSDPKHTAWCTRTAVELVCQHKAQLGPAAHFLSHDTREALLMARVLGVISSQENGAAPLWRMQELINITTHVFMHGVPR